jgi:hypothetical protein
MCGLGVVFGREELAMCESISLRKIVCAGVMGSDSSPSRESRVECSPECMNDVKI